MYRDEPQRRRECLYYLALGNLKLGNHAEAKRACSSALRAFVTDVPTTCRLQWYDMMTSLDRTGTDTCNCISRSTAGQGAHMTCRARDGDALTSCKGAEQPASSQPRRDD